MARKDLNSGNVSNYAALLREDKTRLVPAKRPRAIAKARCGLKMKHRTRVPPVPTDTRAERNKSSLTAIFMTTTVNQSSSELSVWALRSRATATTLSMPERKREGEEAELNENYHAQSNTVVDDNARMELGEGATSVQDGHETFWGRRFAEKREASRRDIKRLGLRSRATTLWLDRYELEESHRVSKMKLHVALIPCHGVAKERS
jgi:hypothetical protein